MENNSFVIDILGAIDQKKTQKQVNSDIKQLEKTIKMLRLTATLAKGSSKKEINAYIQTLSNQLSTIKLKAKIDSKNLKSEIGSILNKVSFKDIDILDINENKTKLKIQKVIADAKAYTEKNPISIGINYENRRNKLDNDLTAYLNRNTKINESSVLLKEADKVRTLIGAINDKNSLKEATDAFQLYKSSVASVGFNTKSTTDKIKAMFGHVTKIGSAFGVASMAVNNFVKSMKTLRQNDTILTEISKTSEMTKQQLKELGDEAFKTASKYGELSSNYLIAVQEMARSGYEDTSNELGKLSLLAQSAGDMTADSANNYLLATDAAYKYGGSIEKLNAALDGANYISNKNSAALTDIADATRVSASFAANANIAIDELTAAEATMIATTKRSGSEIGRAFRSIILNLQQVSGEFDGEIIDEEQLKKVEARCHSMGVELEYVKDGIATLRNPMEVLRELADVYNSLPDNSADKQGLISDLGGKYHANALSSLLSRWDMYEKMLSEFSQGTGSALEEAEKTANSWEGRLNSLQNSWDSFINTLTNKEAVMGGISFFDKLIQGAETLTDVIGEIPVVLTTLNTAMTVMNKDYGITQLVNKGTGKFDVQGNIFGIDISGIKNLKKHYEEAEIAIAKWNSRLAAGKVDINDFDDALAKNSAQFKAYLQTTSKEAPASLAGYKASLNAAGISTDALRLKTILLNSAISMGIGIAIQAAVQGISYLIQREENLRQATQESASAYKESASSIEDYASQYQELHKVLLEAKGNEEETYNVKRQLLDLQTELNSKYGEEYGSVNLVTDAYKDQIEVIRSLNKEKANAFLNENREGIAKATEEMTEERTYNLSYTGMSSDTDEGAALKEIAEKYADQGIRINTDKDTGTYNIILEADVQSAYDTINAFENDVREKAKEFEDEHIFDDVLEISSAELNNAKKVIDEYTEIYRQALTAEIASDNTKTDIYNEALEAVNEYNEAVLKSEDPYNDNNVIEAKTNLDKIKESIQGNEEELGKYSTIFDDVFAQADTRILDFNEKLKNDSGLQDLANNLNGLSDIDLKALDENVGDNESFDKLKEYAEGYNVSLNELIDTLIRLGYVQGKVQDSVSEIEVEVSFEDAWADSFTSENEKVKELGNTLLDLAEKGRLTVDTFNEADSTEYFKNLGISADIAVSKINKLVDESKQLSSMSDQISAMANALGTKMSDGFVDADTLAGFDVEVRGLESWDRFQEVLGSTTSSYQECREAANELATEWVNSSDFLAQLTEDTKEYYKTQLESMGVENYDEVIESTLALKEAKEALIDVDLSDASYEDIEALIAEGEYSALVTEQMWALYYAKLAESGTFLDSSADCAQLQALANDAMLTAEAVELLNQLIQIYNGLEAGAYNNNRALRAEAVAEATRIKTELENLAKGEGAGLIAKPEIKVNGNKGKKSGGSGSSKDKWKEQYDAELKELEHMHKLGLISDEEYWKARMDLNEKYFGESSGMHEKYLEEYQENEEDILEGLKKLWEDYYDERKNNLKDLISYAEKLYDKEIDSLEANIKQIEEKRDTEKKYWQGRIDAIGDEIDALEDANDERERAIDLQQKQWNLQKAMHQRVILLYSENKGMHYVNDSKAERDAKNELDDAENDIKIADLKKQQEDLEKQLDVILETYDSQIEAIEKQIDSLKEVKTAWSDIVENQEFKELEEKLKSLFGNDVKDKILSGNTDFINSIISQYSNTSDMLRTIEDATLADIQNMVAQYGVLPENLMPIADAAVKMADTLGAVDTSGFNTNLDNTAQSSSNAAGKVQSVATALNNLSNDVSNYQMPALNTDNFVSVFAEDGGILTALNSFMERYKEICDSIPEIWNNSLAEAFGQGGGNGDPLAGGLANDTKYDALFEPLVKALNNCRTNMEAKLKECLETFTTFQADLSGIIGVGGSEDSSASQSGAESANGKGSGGEKKSESSGNSDTIVGAIQEGGKLIDKALNGEEDSWSASFNTAKDSIHETATSIVDCIESMVETVVDACIKAIEAINMLASADENNPNNPTPSPYGKVGHAHAEGINGTKTDEKDSIVSEYGQREMTVFPNGKTVITDTPTAMDMPKGTVVYNKEQTEKILKNKVTATGNAYTDGTDDSIWTTLADGTKVRPLQPGDKMWDMYQKFDAYFKSIDGNLEKLVPNSLYEQNREWNKLADQISYVSNITNNNRNVQQPIHNEIHVTLPNVTNATSAESLLRDLESIGRKKFQVNW